MKVDTMAGFSVTSGAGPAAREAEERGFDGLWTAETAHDPFLPLVPAAEHTERVELGTSITVAFPRSPMHLAYTANDLQLLSEGRFVLGLGSQIKPHIEKRFSATWSRPAARMREMVLAMRAIWASWNDRTKLEFRGELYTHTLMTPFFDPGPNPHGAPRVFVAAVGERMTEVAGEVCDGMIAHAFTTERYLREVTLPALDRGFAKGGRSRADFEIACPLFVVTGSSDAEVEAMRGAICNQIAFYGSTPAYRPVLELHGWGDLQTELHGLSKQGEWAEMGRRIPDEVVDAFAVVAAPDDVPKRIEERFKGLLDRMSFYLPFQPDPDQWSSLLSALKAI